MLYYPQLQTGAVAQYPIARSEFHRTVIDTMPDGSTVRAADIGAGAVRWALTYSHLTTAEWAALDTLFAACQGRLNSFVFLDPTDNLLLWSSDLTNTAWTPDPLVSIAPAAGDPTGGANAFTVTNGGQAAQGFRQTLAVPSSLTYCFSLFVKSAGSKKVTLTASGSSGSTTKKVTSNSQWMRVSLTSSLATQDTSLSFGISVAAGVRISVYGLQVEAQTAPSLYKPTTDRSGVYPYSRFDTDTLTLNTTGVNQHSGLIRLMSTTKD
jgi:hypothetical protein